MSSAFEKENEYFVREDTERIRKLAHGLHRELDAVERERRRALHWMRCPRCGIEMHEVRYRGMTVDVCLECHGIFLDEHELMHLARPPAHGVMSGILNWFRQELNG